MKKKSFSLMAFFLLALMGAARADVIEIGAGQNTTYQTPFNSLYEYSFVEQIYTAEDIEASGNIRSISFNMSSATPQSCIVEVFMKNVSRYSFSTSTDYEPVVATDRVYSGTWNITQGWSTIVLNRPFFYNGVNNLLIAIRAHNVDLGTTYFYCTGAPNTGISFHSNTVNPDPLDLGSFVGGSYASSNRANIRLEMSRQTGNLTVFDGTATNRFVPIYTAYTDAYEKCEMVYPADTLESIVGRKITSMKFYTSKDYFDYSDVVFQVFLTEYPLDYINGFHGTAGATMVYEGGLVIANHVMTIQFDEPFHYDGGNLLVGVYVTETGGWDNTPWYGETVNGASVQGYSYDGLYAINPTQRNFLPKATFHFEGEDLHVAYHDGDVYVLDQLNLGSRPNGAWTEPFAFDLFHNFVGPLQVNHIDCTPVAPFTVSGPELPIILDNDPVTFGLSVGEVPQPGIIDAQMVALYGDDRTAAVWPVVVEMYNPAVPDVWELACEDATAFPFVEAPATAHHIALHNDYTLPFPQIREGKDAVYRLVFDQDRKLNAIVSRGGNGKVALYREGFEGEGGPMSTNYYRGPQLDEGNRAVLRDSQMNNIVVTMSDGYGDGWNGGYINVAFGANSVNLACIGASTVSSLPIPGGAEVTLNWVAGNFDSEVSFIVAYEDGTVIYSDDGPAAGTLATFTMSGVANPSAYVNLDFNLFDGYGDGWDSGCLVVNYGMGSLTLTNFGSTSYNKVALPAGAHVTLTWVDSNYNEECSFEVLMDGETIYSIEGPTAGLLYEFDLPGGGDQPVGISYGPVITNAPVPAGTYYLVASSTTDNFEVTIDTDDMPCPDVNGFAFNPTPFDGEDDLEPASVMLHWNVPTYATEWRLVFGSTYHPEANHPQTLITEWSRELANSYEVTGLWNNTNYFWRIEFRNDGCTEGVSSPVWGFTTNLNKPHELTAVDENVFEDEQIVLNWTAIQDRTFRTYFIYRNGEKIGQTNTNHVNATTFTDGPLPYDMNGYTYYVTAVYDEGESGPSNTVTVNVSGYSNATGVNGYVWEQDGTTGIQGALVTITATDEFGDEHTYTATSGANGYYSTQIHAGAVSNAVATLDGYQETVTVHELPFSVAHNAQEDNVNFLMDENFDPVCSVIAEYYPDSLDPNSPYVKVYWGCGLPGEAKTADRSLHHYRVYRTSCYNDGPYTEENTVLLSSVWVPDTVYVDVEWADLPAGVYKYGVGSVYEGNRDLQLERESEIVWSNCVDKDMYLSNVSVNVLLNSADSPEGTTVSFTNYNANEQERYPVAPVVLDESGYYAWDSFRKGNYEVRVEHDGFEMIVDSVGIWEPAHLRYVMIEIIYGIHDLYVSRTGWAMWESGAFTPLPAGRDGEGRQLQHFKVMCTSIDGDPIFNANTSHNFCQLDTDGLVPGQHYICKVAAMYSTGMSEWVEAEWAYMECDQYPVASNVNMTTENDGNHIIWEYNGDNGFMLFRDGEWLAEIHGQNIREYVDEGEFGTHEYCVRVIFDGEAMLPDNNFYYAMSCPMCDGGDGNTGIGDNDGSLALYPNPTHGKVTIEGQDLRRITVVNAIGQVAFDKELNANAFTFDLSQYGTGVYMVRVYTEQGLSLKRIVVTQ